MPTTPTSFTRTEHLQLIQLGATLGAYHIREATRCVQCEWDRRLYPEMYTEACRISMNAYKPESSQEHQNNMAPAYLSDIRTILYTETGRACYGWQEMESLSRAAHMYDLVYMAVSGDDFIRSVGEGHRSFLVRQAAIVSTLSASVADLINKANRNGQLVPDALIMLGGSLVECEFLTERPDYKSAIVESAETLIGLMGEVGLDLLFVEDVDAQAETGVGLAGDVQLGEPGFDWPPASVTELMRSLV